MPVIDSSTKFVGINPNFPTAERKSAQNNAAQEVVKMQDIIDTVNAAGGSQTFQQVSDAGGFDNFSTIRQGAATRFFGIRGLELVCVNDKMIQWADGREYYYINNGGTIEPIVHCNSLNDDIPDNTFDETIGFAVGSRYTVLNTGITHICTDATTDSAIWLPMGGEYIPVLDEEGGAVEGVTLIKANYNINNGIVDVSICATIDVDFSLLDSGTFSFTLPTDSIGATIGSGSIKAANQCNVFVESGTISIFSNDTTFIANDVAFAANFKYQAY
jgi:hypothetical protein